MPAMAGGTRSLTATGYAGRRSVRGSVPTPERGNEQKNQSVARRVGSAHHNGPTGGRVMGWRLSGCDRRGDGDRGPGGGVATIP